MRDVLDDPATSGLSEAEKELFAFVDKVNHHTPYIGPADIAQLHAVGWSDEALFQTITVCALFNFYNRWVDGSGVQPLDAETHRGHAKRMARAGYVRSAPKASEG
ncbi:MAG: hypothetical protein R2724_19070 [Bryobacterales bacterium]